MKYYYVYYLVTRYHTVGAVQTMVYNEISLLSYSPRRMAPLPTKSGEELTYDTNSKIKLTIKTICRTAPRIKVSHYF